MSVSINGLLASVGTIAISRITATVFIRSPVTKTYRPGHFLVRR
jgi:hypothetical protein